MRKKNGFTLMELLIVIAIIVVLVAVAIPVFSAQMTKAKRAKDEANLRAAYAEGVNHMMAEKKTKQTGVFTAKVNLSGSYTEFRIFGTLYFSEGKPTYMPKANVIYKNGEAYLKPSGMSNKKYIIVRVRPDGTVGYEALANHSHHVDGYYDSIYGTTQG